MNLIPIPPVRGALAVFSLAALLIACEAQPGEPWPARGEISA